MTTDKERAETWFRIAELYESLGGYSISAADARRRGESLDPPQPQWESGQIAWVTDKKAGRHLCVWRNSCRAWCIGGHPGTGGSRVLYNPIKVEPLRVLADDEVAINVGREQRAGYWRGHAEHVGYGCPTARDVCKQIADAIEKRGSRS